MKNKVARFYLRFCVKARHFKVKVKRIFRRMSKRMVALFMVCVTLLSLVSYGWLHQETEVQALAGVDDAVFSVFWELATLMGSLAGGASVSDVVESREAAGITDFPSAQQYVKDSYTNHPNFSKMFDFSDTAELLRFEEALAKTYLLSTKVLKKEWVNLLLDQYDKVDGTSALDFSTAFENISSKIIMFPGGDDEDPTPSPSPEPGEGDSESNVKVFPTTFMPLVFETSLFQIVNYLTKIMKVDDYRSNFDLEYDKEGSPEGAPSLIPYSFEYWLENPYIFKISSPKFHEDFKKFAPSSNLSTCEVGSIFYVFGTNYFNSHSSHSKWLNSNIYPGYFFENGSLYIGLTTDKGIWNIGDFFKDYVLIDNFSSYYSLMSISTNSNYFSYNFII